MHITRNQTDGHGNHTAEDVMVSYRNCGCNDTVTPPIEYKDKVEVEAFMYIVVVVVLYATSITFLLIRYARNYDEEKDFKYHYSEFVNRDRFQALTYRNKLALERTKIHLENIRRNGENRRNGISCSELKRYGHRNKDSKSQWNQKTPASPLNCPVITITSCSDGSQNSLADNTIRLNGIDSDSVLISKHESTACNDVRMDLLTVPLAMDCHPRDMALSCDSGVDYLGNHVPDDTVDCEWYNEKGLDYGCSGKRKFSKSSSSNQLQDLKAVVYGGIDQSV